MFRVDKDQSKCNCKHIFFCFKFISLLHFLSFSHSKVHNFMLPIQLKLQLQFYVVFCTSKWNYTHAIICLFTATDPQKPKRIKSRVSRCSFSESSKSYLKHTQNKTKQKPICSVFILRSAICMCGTVCAWFVFFLFLNCNFNFGQCFCIWSTYVQLKSTR